MEKNYSGCAPIHENLHNKNKSDNASYGINGMDILWKALLLFSRKTIVALLIAW